MPSVAPPPTSVAAITLSVYRAPSCTKMFGVSDHNLPNLPVILGPNITGSFNQRSADAASAHGCISVSHTGNFAYKLALNADARAGDLFDFNASRSSSIYGAS